MTISLAQPSFARGEIAPDLAGRVDLEAYQTGLRKCTNNIVTPYGGFLNRPGTVFLEQTEGNEAARMIRFKFNNNDAYALEFTHLRMRVYRNGGIVLNTSGPNVGLPFTLTTPYTRDEIFSLNYTQSADVMTIVMRNHVPHQLTRLDHDNWTIGPLAFVPGVSTPTGVGATSAPGSGATQTWQYQVTAVVDSGTSIEESLPGTSPAVTVFASVLSATVVWGAVPGASYFNIYKDNSGSGVYGFIGRSTTATFVDNNISPVKTDTPPTGLDPFVGAGNFPGAVTYYQQRLVFAGTLNKPQTLWFSRTGIFTNFGYSTPVKDDDAITWTMASLDVNQIMHLAPLRSLLSFTDGAEWTIQGTTAGFTPKTINGDPQSYNGIGTLRPLLIGNDAVYAQERGREITSFSYSLEADGFSGSDISILSPHMLQDFGLFDWDYQKIPYHIIWGVRTDGDLVGVTYVPQQNVTAWHHHQSDGSFISVCSVPEGREDFLYFCVRRNINGVEKHYVERMASRTLQTYAGKAVVSQAFFVDCGLTYDGTNATAETMTVTDGTTWKYPELMTLVSSNPSRFQLGDVGDEVQYVPNPLAQPFRFEIVSYFNGSVVNVRPKGEVPLEIRNVPFTTWAFARDTISGLGHLEGKTVSILADGNVAPREVVSGGSITLANPAAIIHVGLPYRSTAETLEINVPNQETLLDKTKQISEVTLLLKDTRGGKVGSKESALFEIKQRSDQDGYGSIPTLNGTARATVSDTWNGTGRFLIVQDDPLPMNVLAAIPRADAGGAR